MSQGVRTCICTVCCSIANDQLTPCYAVGDMSMLQEDSGAEAGRICQETSGAHPRGGRRRRCETDGLLQALGETPSYVETEDHVDQAEDYDDRGKEG